MNVCCQEMNGCTLVVLIIQIITWTLVSILLLFKGLENMWKSYDLKTDPSDIESENLPRKAYTAGLVTVIVASVMMALGPTFVIVVVIEKCYRKHKFKKLSQEDLPPKYEDVVREEGAPRYSTLFLNNENLENN